MGSSSIKRRGGDLKRFVKGLQALPRLGAIEVAKQASTALTTALASSFDAGLTAYDESRPLGSSGNKLDLVKSGLLRALLQFVYDGGTNLRAALSTPYARFQIRFGLLPVGGDPMPAKWLRLLDGATATGMDKEAKKLS